MTIVVGVAAPDGIILAADSRTTYTSGDHYRISSDSAHKLFALGARFAVATHGLSFIGPQTIAGHMDEWVGQLQTVPSDVAAFAELLGKFFDARLAAAWTADELKDAGELLGFLVAGYDAAGVGQLLEVSLPGGTVTPSTITTSEIGTLWRGQTDVVRRLIKGVDWWAFPVGVELTDDVEKALEQLEYNLLSPITLEDAVDFARFLIRTTVDMQRFSDGLLGGARGIPGCGGPVRVVAVTRGGVQWVDQPSLAAPA